VVNSNSRYAGSVRTGKESYWDRKDSDFNGYTPDYPPMPAYDPNAYPPQPGYAAYAVSLQDDGSTLYGEHEDYGKDYGMKTSLTHGSTNAHQDPYGGAYGNEAYAQGQHRDRYTPDPYGTDPYGRNATHAHTGYDATTHGAYDANAYAQSAYDTDAYGGTYQQPQQTHYDENAAQYHHQQQDAAPQYHQQQQQQQPPRQMPSRNGSKWDGGQAY